MKTWILLTFLCMTQITTIIPSSDKNDTFTIYTALALTRAFLQRPLPMNRINPLRAAEQDRKDANDLIQRIKEMKQIFYNNSKK